MKWWGFEEIKTRQLDARYPESNEDIYWDRLWKETTNTMFDPTYLFDVSSVIWGALWEVVVMWCEWVWLNLSIWKALVYIGRACFHNPWRIQNWESSIRDPVCRNCFNWVHGPLPRETKSDYANPSAYPHLRSRQCLHPSGLSSWCHPHRHPSELASVKTCQTGTRRQETTPSQETHCTTYPSYQSATAGC